MIEACNALAPVCGDRCTLPKGHSEPDHQNVSATRGTSGWFGDHSNDPGALASEARCKRKLPATGRPSPRYGHLGLWVFSLGPNGNPRGTRLQLGLIDATGNVARRFEQIEGRCLDQGYVDFFLGPNCRPAVYEMPLVDIAPDGTQTVLVRHHTEAMGMQPYLNALGAWCAKYGCPAWDLLDGKGPSVR